MGCWRGSDGLLEGVRCAARRGQMGCWRGSDVLLEGVRWAAGGGQMGCWRGLDGLLEEVRWAARGQLGWRRGSQVFYWGFRVALLLK
eukprot:1179991-Prorocentrum_minimum.AAC.1